MEHVMYNERKHPENKRGFKPTIFSSTDNRNRALRDVKFMPGSARDEKPPNSAIHDGTTTTTRYLPIPESKRERNLLSLTTRKARAFDAKMRYHASFSPDYHGRGDKSLTPPGRSPTAPDVMPPWNAGPGLHRSPTRGRSPGPVDGPSKPRAREPSRSPSRDHSSPGASEPPRSPTPELDTNSKGKGKAPSKAAWNAGPAAGPSESKSGGGKGKERAREPSSSRSPSRDHSHGAPEPPKSRSPTQEPDTKGKGKAPSKPAWNAGPGVRRSNRIAELPPKTYFPKKKT